MDENLVKPRVSFHRTVSTDEMQLAFVIGQDGVCIAKQPAGHERTTLSLVSSSPGMMYSTLPVRSRSNA